jgi:AcrR family transcriptional regulator
MARPKDPTARTRILAALRTQVARHGVDGWTLQGVADQLHLTKQAVLHHFGSKHELLRALVVEEISHEATAIQAAVAHAKDAADAVALCVRATTHHHLKNLDRFRLVYTVVQGKPVSRQLFTEADRKKEIYPVSEALYSAIERAISADPKLQPGVHPRRLAVAAHQAALGIVCYAGMVDAVNGTFGHSTRAIVDELVRSMTDGLRSKN